MSAAEVQINHYSAALRYAQLGLAVFPLHTPVGGGCSCSAGTACQNVGKHPRTANGLKDATTDEKVIRGWWRTWPTANVGVVAGSKSGFFVVDVDPAHGGQETLAELEAEHGALPATVEALTGSGGRHLLFACPDFPVRNHQGGKKLGLGIDIRGDGGYIVVAPSLHASGNSYEWQPECAPWDRKVAGAPAWLLERLRAVPPGPTLVQPRQTSVDNAYRRASAYLARIPGAISGSGGHDQTWKAALVVVRGFRLSESEAFGLLWNEYNPRCDPPWSEKEVQHKVQQAMHDASVPFGYLLDVERQQPKPPPASTAALAVPDAAVPAVNDAPVPSVAPPFECRIISLPEVLNPPVEHFLVGTLFPMGKASVLYGPSGAGKSTFISQLVFRVAAGGGGALLGMFLHDQAGGDVVVYTAEDTYDDWVRKAAANRAGCKDIDIGRALERITIIDKTEGEARLSEDVKISVNNGFEVRSKVERRSTPDRDHLIEVVKQRSARLVVLETLSRLVPDEDNPNMSAILAAAGHVARETGAAVIISHHPTKAASAENNSRSEGMRGGGAATANARCVVSIFPGDERVLGFLREQGFMFPDEDVLVIEQQKGTSSVRKQKPIIVIRCSTPWGGYLELPEHAAADPAQVKLHLRKIEKQREAAAGLLARLYDVVEDMKGLGRVSANKLRGRHSDIGIGKNRVDALVAEAIRSGVLVAGDTDAKGRLLDLDLGTRPETGRPSGDHE